MREGKGCELCRFQLCDPNEAPMKGFYCTNEESEHFGEVVTKCGNGGCGCDKRENTDYRALREMSLKDALKTVILPDNGSYPSFKFNYGRPDDKYVWAARSFKSNRDLNDYRNALTRLFEELMRLMEEDGDFEDE